MARVVLFLRPAELAAIEKRAKAMDRPLSAQIRRMLAAAISLGGLD